MYNKKTLSKATAELDKAKAPKKPKDIITDPMGQWKYPGLPTRIPGNDITMKGVGYPVLGVANNGQRKIMLPGADYTFPGAQYVDEYPQMKKGGAKKKRKTKSIMGTNKLMQKGPLFKDYSKRIYDPNVDYFQKGGPQNTSGPRNIQPSYDYDDQQFHQNDPAGYDEFINGPGHAPDTYKFSNHPTFSNESMYSNEETPGGEWMENPDGSWKFKASSTNRKNMSKEEMQDYFNKVEPGNELEYEDGGYIEADLTDDEIEEYRKGGFIVEDISVPELNQAQKGGESKVILSKEHTDKKGNKTIVVTKDDGTKYTKVISKDGKVYNDTQAGLSPEMRAYGKKIAEWENRSSGAAQPVDDVWTLPIGMTSAGVKGTIGLAKGLTSLGRNAVKSSLVQSGKAGLKKSLVKSLPGSSINNLVGSGFAGTALTDIVTGKVAEPWKKANKSGKGSDYVDAVAENMFTAMDAYPLYKPVSKGLKQLGKYATTLPGKLSKTKANSIPKRATSIGLDESLNHLFKKNPNYSKETFDNVGDFNYKQFSEGDEALKDLKSGITSEPTLGKSDVYSNAELQKKIQNYKNWRNEIDEVYKEYKKLDPSGNSSNSDLRNLHPHLKKRWDALKNIDKSITDKFITKEQEKLIRENYPELISTLDTRNDLSRRSLKKLGEDKLPEPMPEEAIDILKSLNLYKKPNKNLLKFEPGKMNKLGGLVKAQKGGIVLKLNSKEIQDYIKQGYIVEDVD
jgi:hypothetical protein